MDRVTNGLGNIMWLCDIQPCLHIHEGRWLSELLQLRQSCHSVTRIRMFAYVNIVHTRAHTHVQAHTHTRAHAHTHMCRHTHTHTHTHTHKHTHTHTHKHTHTHTHTHTPNRESFWIWSIHITLVECLMWVQHLFPKVRSLLGLLIKYTD